MHLDTADLLQRGGKWMDSFPLLLGSFCKSISGDIGVGEPHTKNAFRRSFVRRFRILAFQIDIQSGRAGDPLSPLGGRGGVGG